MTARLFPTHPVLPSLAVAGLLLLTACASTPPPIQRYTLPQLAPTPTLPAATRDPVRVQLAPLSMADYLDSRGLLYQSSDITINEASGHVWAENIRDQLGRAMRQELSVALPALWVSDALQMLPADPKDYVLGIQVERFQGRHDGVAVISGSWSLRNAAGQLLETRPYLVEKTLAANGYPALVHSLDDAWRTLALSIATALAERDQRLRMPEPR